MWPLHDFMLINLFQFFHFFACLQKRKSFRSTDSVDECSAVLSIVPKLLPRKIVPFCGISRCQLMAFSHRYGNEQTELWSYWTKYHKICAQYTLINFASKRSSMFRYSNIFRNASATNEDLSTDFVYKIWLPLPRQRSLSDRKRFRPSLSTFVVLPILKIWWRSSSSFWDYLSHRSNTKTKRKETSTKNI